ncbi:MAG: T9SS type A sorting domain-containing protein, partial [Bacteroidota bacterium]
YDIKYNSLKMYDAYGKIVSQNFETDEEHKFRIDLTGIQSGIYFIQLKTDNISIIKKIIHLTTQ